ncbi:WD domain G-beta repeat uncharacterized protein [Allonocardiopsis opalescens]|uniref:WD domain G-beta repeat uncharacterized protein n=2 Tax=Allonocardiopsis opalescens TaxID=1144618 RepID=A0A2T0PPW3_9ACTN|nr:WD domain G-beta repeat uncharacterized protein [Allonocardiopsis opalescens]
MGRVYLGRSPGRRLVAVKVIRSEYADDPEFRRRFGREVASAQSVSGAFTAPVIDAGPDDALPWLVTTYVAGPSLQAAVERHGPFPAPSVWVLAVALAEALGSIHRAGVIHRDLKPANVLLAPDGPRVIDFGIAHAADTSAATRTGITGTPGYMAPEQIDGQQATAKSDVFALGAVLSYASTGEPPFGDDAPTAVLMRVLREQPRLYGVPLELRALLLACMEKEPDRRPGPDDILREAGDSGPGNGPWLPEPVRTMITQFEQKAGEVSGDGAAPAAAAAESGGGPGTSGPHTPPVQTGPHAKGTPTGPPGPTPPPRPGGVPQRAMALPTSPQGPYAPAPAGGYSGYPPQRQRAGVSNAAVLTLGVIGVVLVLFIGAVTVVALSSDRESGSGGSGGSGWTGGGGSGGGAGGGQPFAGHGGPVQDIAVSPDGGTAASIGDDATAIVWDAATGEQITSFSVGTGSYYSVSISDGGGVIAVGNGASEVGVWDVESGEQIDSFTYPGSTVHTVALSPDGTMLAAGGTGTGNGLETDVPVWDVESGRQVATLRGHSDWVRELDFSAEGNAIATISDDTTAGVWDPETGDRIATLDADTSAWLYSVDISADGSRVVSAAEYGDLFVWDVAAEEQVSEISYQGNLIEGVAISADGSTVAVADDAGVTTYDAESGTQQDNYSGAANTVVFSPDGGTLLSGGDDNTVRRWDVQ